MNCKFFDKKNTTPKGVEIFFAKPEGCKLAREMAAYLCIRFYYSVRGKKKNRVKKEIILKGGWLGEGAVGVFGICF